MNIKQVKQQFTLESLLARLGFNPNPKKSKGHDLWYISPLRPSEKDPSFHISTKYNIWKDFGAMEEGGDLIRFGQVYLKSHGKGHSISETLKWFDSLGGRPQLHHFNDAVRRQEETAGGNGWKRLRSRIMKDRPAG